METDGKTTQSETSPRLLTGGDHNRAIDTAIELLGAVLREEAEEHAGRQASLLRGRLAQSSATALRARVYDVGTATSAERTRSEAPR